MQSWVASTLELCSTNNCFCPTRCLPLSTYLYLCIHACLMKLTSVFKLIINSDNASLKLVAASSARLNGLCICYFFSSFCGLLRSLACSASDVPFVPNTFLFGFLSLKFSDAQLFNDNRTLQFHPLYVDTDFPAKRQ